MWEGYQNLKINQMSTENYIYIAHISSNIGHKLEDILQQKLKFH